MQETWVQSLGRENALEREAATTAVFMPGESPWTEGLDGLQSMRSQRVRHNWARMHADSSKESTHSNVLNFYKNISSGAPGSVHIVINSLTKCFITVEHERLAFQSTNMHPCHVLLSQGFSIMVLADIWGQIPLCIGVCPVYWNI